MTKEGKSTSGEKTEKQPCQGSLADIAIFPLFSRTTNPEGQTAGWVSLLLPYRCTIPAFAGSISLCRGASLLSDPVAGSCSGAGGAGGVTQAVVTPRHCWCSPAVVLFSHCSPQSMVLSAPHQLLRDPPREGGSPSQPEEMKDSCQLRQGGFAGEHHGFHIYFARLVTLSCICHSSF